MSQDPRIMAAAWRKFSAEREARRAALAQLTREVHQIGRASCRERV